MRRLHWQVLKAILISSVVGCGFNPGAPGETLTGGAASSGTGTGTGAGGVTGNGTGIGLTSGSGGDVGMGTGGMTCGQSSVPVMPVAGSTGRPGWQASSTAAAAADASPTVLRRRCPPRSRYRPAAASR